MQKKTDGSQDFSLQQAMQLAQTPEGRQLFALLQSTQPGTLQQAMDNAASGDMQQLKQTVQSFMQSREAMALLEKMRGSQNG